MNVGAQRAISLAGGFAYSLIWAAVSGLGLALAFLTTSLLDGEIGSSFAASRGLTRAAGGAIIGLMLGALTGIFQWPVLAWRTQRAWWWPLGISLAGLAGGILGFGGPAAIAVPFVIAGGLFAASFGFGPLALIRLEAKSFGWRLLASLASVAAVSYVGLRASLLALAIAEDTVPLFMLVFFRLDSEALLSGILSGIVSGIAMTLVFRADSRLSGWGRSIAEPLREFLRTWKPPRLTDLRKLDWRFLIGWVVASMAGAVLYRGFDWLIGGSSAWVEAVIRAFADETAQAWAYVIVQALFNFASALFVGSAQWVALRWRVRRAWRWIPATSIAIGFASLLINAAALSLPALQLATLAGLAARRLLFGFSLAIVGASQWLVLRSQFPRAVWLIPLSATLGFFTRVVAANQQNDTAGLFGGLGYSMLWVSVGAAVLLWILGKPRQPGDPPRRYPELGVVRRDLGESLGRPVISSREDE